ncbi:MULTISPECIES: CheR family methyltransferase [unclassified Methylobacterium]|uniref:CheR family methyltransferase n=1 Tax=unclassified Methylobacterium TaxID=2615210 RepID=UPI001FB9AA0B|nr:MULTISPECIES: protein-glutamate O-methyltransferase CheR [unclassified Methylobacterium]MCJ2091942.1 protein-glutamate O-methyltransferase CheR [Methylobacterium sp. J-072]MCJ2139837.1 protein-glutamate O-methyltransferase CheR [Methylobacterium sp. E-066]
MQPNRTFGQTTPAIQITEDDYEKFYEYFYRRTGISFSGKKEYFVEKRLLERIAKTGSDSFKAYFTLLRFQASGEELQHLVNLMTVNETYFFREDYQFDALVRGILPEITRTRRPGGTLRIWSMPCSTGEEPYSIAIQILEYWSRADEFAIEITGSDIDSRVLADARKGIYGNRSLQRLSPELRKKYFRRLGDDQFEIHEELRGSIEFSIANLSDPIHMHRYRAMDVIFCRNLLIYFDDTSRRAAVEALYECLVPGGFICLGHSESMSRMSSMFLPRKFGDTIVYQRPIDQD